MVKATLDDEDVVVDILSKSFDSNQSINFIVKQDSKRKERIEFLIRYSFFIGIQFGEIFLSNDRKSCCILLYSDKKKTTFHSVIWDVKLLFRSIGLRKLNLVLQREFQLKKFHPKKPFVHLWYIGVLPEYQGEKKGSFLLKNVLGFCEKLSKSVYLETSTLRNLPFYKKFGFNVVGKIDSIGYKLYIMKYK